MRQVWAWIFAAVALTACGGSGGSPTTTTATGRFAFEAGDVQDGQPIAPRFTCDGQDASPALSWTGAPAGMQSLALVVEDPDAPGRTFTHWLVYEVAPAVDSLAGGVPAGATEWRGASLRQGVNDFGHPGYAGPCPPRGETHHYVFRLLALDSELTLPIGADRASLDRAVGGHTLAEARLVASYSRPGDSTNGG